MFFRKWLGVGREVEEGGGAYKRAGLSGGGGGVVSWVACLFVVVRDKMVDVLMRVTRDREAILIALLGGLMGLVVLV